VSRRSVVRPVVIAGGGTAGHILPGLSIAAALIERGHSVNDIAWIGSSRGQEATLVPPSGIALSLLPGRGIQRRLTPTNLVSAAGLLVAAVQALWIIGRRRPAAVLCLGGYASVAAAAAAVVWRVPLIIAEQNAVPGAANRAFGRFAAAAAVPFEGVDLPRSTVTGNPVRAEILALRPAQPSQRSPLRDEARAALEVEEGRILVVAFAGSLGSRRINEAVAGFVEAWADRSDLAVHHVIGRRDWDTFQRPGVAPDEIAYRCVEYEERMDLVLAAADLAVCRSGGTTVAELATVGVPSILVPLPIAPGDHQRFNALALANVDAAVVLNDTDCTPEGLVREIGSILAEGRRDAMAAGAWSQGRPNAAADVAALIDGVIGR